METPIGTLRMTLSDVAALARVQRPVVSMWRKRSSTGPLPFPQAIETLRGVEHFDASEVTAWLQATGRGNNQEARNDVAIYAKPASTASEPPRDNRQTFDGLTSLLTLKVVTGETLSEASAAELLDALRAK